MRVEVSACGGPPPWACPAAFGPQIRRSRSWRRNSFRRIDFFCGAYSFLCAFVLIQKHQKIKHGEKQRVTTPALTERAQKTPLLRRNPLRRFDCGGSAKSASGLCVRLLNVVLHTHSWRSPGAVTSSATFAVHSGRPPACRIALRKERKDSYAPLHSVRNDKSCHPQEEVQTNSDTGIAPCIAPQTAEKKAVSDRFSAHLPENRKIIRNFVGQSINCRARI